LAGERHWQLQSSIREEIRERERERERDRERVAASLRRVPTGIDRNYVPYDTIEENLLALDFHH
jgi:predicted dithiol-disulfide oxidoreductase (DUF899 family)